VAAYQLSDDVDVAATFHALIGAVAEACCNGKATRLNTAATVATVVPKRLTDKYRTLILHSLPTLAAPPHNSLYGFSTTHQFPVFGGITGDKIPSAQ
jgi:hypothetical protein